MLLCGKWQLSGLDPNGKDFKIEAAVPGCVHTDLMKAGMIPDPFYRDNADLCQWIENGDFTYEKTFTLDKVEENTFLEFDGLDTYADVFLNGKKIGHSENMFLPCAFCADGALCVGENTLTVKFFSPIRAVAGKPERRAAFTTERVYTRRIQCTYGWDWVARFVTMGIFRDVRLSVHEKNTVVHPYVYTKAVTPYGAQVGLDVEIRDFCDCGDVLKITLKSPKGEVVWQKERTLLEPTLHEVLNVRDAELWYPQGYGAQPLYTLELETPAGKHSTVFGIREVVILQLPDEKGGKYEEMARKLQKAEHLKDRDYNEVTSGFTVLVNDVPIFCRGGDWVPCSPFPSEESDEKIERLLDLAVQANMNMLRVWGGGLFEKESFYAGCDRRGILLSQDFLMACGNYPDDDPAFVEEQGKEARAAALYLRNHPSIVFYSGDNENAVHGDENRNDYTGYRATIRGLGPVLREYDPYRTFLPSSPYGGKKFSSATVGTTHDTNYLGKIFKPLSQGDGDSYYDILSEFLSRFEAEEPTLGMPFASSLLKFLTEEDVYGEDTSLSEYHTKNNPALGAVTIYGYIEGMAKNLFGDFKDGADRLIKMQWLQCEWVRVTLENHRRHQGFNSGIVYWMYNDCWPAANSWSFVDYYAMPKPSYYAFARAAKPIIASIDKTEDGYAVYVCNSSLSTVRGNLSVSVYDTVTGKVKTVKRDSFVSFAGESRPVLTLSKEKADLGKTKVLMADITLSNGECDRAFFLPCSYKTMGIVPSYPDVEKTADGYVLSAETFMPFALADTEDVLSDNALFLLPAEKKTVSKRAGF